jgi:hypothetical protein
MSLPALVGACAVGVAAAMACGSTEPSVSDPALDDSTLGDPTTECPVTVPATRPANVRLPPPDGSFDYQLGGAYPPPTGVDVVSRDSGAEPAPGMYNICYLNAFQTQPDSDWSGARADLILQRRGRRVEDPEWPGEYVFDLSTAEKRGRLAEIVGTWIRGCAEAGFDAVEFDNLDTFTRFDGVRFNDTVAYASELVTLAHQQALAVAQKNTGEQSACLRALGFDFAVTEQCWEYDECAAYTAVYHASVYDVEYERGGFERGCNAFTSPRPILRDDDVHPPSSEDYVRLSCPIATATR